MSHTPSSIRNELNLALGSQATSYWDTLSLFLSNKISRFEFEESVRVAINTHELIQLHNSLIVSILGSSLHHAPPTPPPEGPDKPSKKRRKVEHGTNPDGDGSGAYSSRLKSWTIGMGKRERERVKALNEAAGALERRPRPEADEIAAERGVRLIPEGEDLPGTYLPVHLGSVTRASTLQHISERVALISTQNNLKNPPSKTVASLMLTACESKLKQLIAQALALTSTSNSITSIQLADMGTQPTTRILTTSSFETLLTVRPATLPYQSAAATRLMAEGSSDSRLDFDQEVHFKERHTEDPRWQLLAMLAERSTVRDALLSGR